ncbi:tRNA lysidine(34) synthetase TilS [Kitasatospora griseola]
MDHGGRKGLRKVRKLFQEAGL